MSAGKKALVGVFATLLIASLTICGISHKAQALPVTGKHHHLLL